MAFIYSIYPAYLCWFITLDLFGFSSPSLCLCFLLVFHLLFFSFSSLDEQSCHWCRTNTEWQLKSQPSTSNPTKAARAVHGRVRSIIRITGGNAHLHTTAAYPQYSSPPTQTKKCVRLPLTFSFLWYLHSITFSSQWIRKRSFFPLIFLWYFPFESSRTTVLYFASSFPLKSIYSTISIVNSTAPNSSIQQRKPFRTYSIFNR